MSIDRRSFIKILGAGVAGLVVGSVLGWVTRPSEVQEITRTVTVTAPGAVERKLSKDTIKIGVIGIRSGLWSTYGEFIEQGARLAAEEINARGGILGSRVELVFRDEMADVVKQARELVSVENVDFIVGIDSSGNALKVGEIVDELGKIVVVTHAATHRLTEELVFKKGKKLIFRSSVPVYQDGILAAYIAKDLPVRRWAGINGDYEFGRVSWELFTKTLKTLRPDVEFVSEQWPKFGTEDFTPFISALLASDAEALHTSIWAVELVTLQRQLVAMGGYRKFKAVISTLGYSMDVAYSLGAGYPTAELGTWVSARYIWLYPPTEINREFVNRFKARWGRLPAYSAETTYSAVYMIKAALENSASLDPDVVLKALEGLVILTPAGVRWVRPEDHQAVYEVPYGRIVHKGVEVPLLEDLRAVPAMLYYRFPPFE
ncbi:MAG: ABC transporter substrate-binding protein [Nitrososphaerota archaeon]